MKLWALWSKRPSRLILLQFSWDKRSFSYFPPLQPGQSVTWLELAIWLLPSTSPLCPYLLSYHVNTLSAICVCIFIKFVKLLYTCISILIRKYLFSTLFHYLYIISVDLSIYIDKACDPSSQKENGQKVTENIPVKPQWHISTQIHLVLL